MTEPKAVVRSKDLTKSHPGVAGRVFTPASGRRTIALARSRGQKALLVAIRRLTKHLTDPTVPVDDVWLRAFAQLADRCGLPKVMVQSSEVRGAVLTASVDAEGIARHLLAEITQSE